MARLTAEHLAMLREISRRCPTPYKDTFTRNDVCSSLEDIAHLLELAEAGMIWFQGYGGELRMVGIWVITRAGAEAAGRRSPVRAGTIESQETPADSEPAAVARARRGR